LPTSLDLISLPLCCHSSGLVCVSAWCGCVCARICESECACKLHCSAGFDVFLHTAVAAGNCSVQENVKASGAMKLASTLTLTDTRTHTATPSTHTHKPRRVAAERKRNQVKACRQRRRVYNLCFAGCIIACCRCVRVLFTAF